MECIRNLSAIVAIDNLNGIGNNNEMPWHYPEDLKWFKQNTLAKNIIMGSKTFSSILKYNNNQLLPHRKHIVLTTQKSNRQDVEYFNKFFQLLENIKKNSSTEYIIVGGAQIYNIALPLVNTLYLTKISANHDCDTFIDINQYPFDEASNYYQYEKGPLQYNIYKRF